MKAPYLFDFLGIGQKADEREIENALVQHITRFWIKLGVGVAFVGWQYHLQVSDDDFFIDLLSYRLKLRCYVAVELKIGAFKLERRAVAILPDGRRCATQSRARSANHRLVVYVKRKTG